MAHRFDACIRFYWLSNDAGYVTASQRRRLVLVTAILVRIYRRDFQRTDIGMLPKVSN